MLLAKVAHQIPMMDISPEAVITLVRPSFLFCLWEHLMRWLGALIADFQMRQEGPFISKGLGTVSTEDPPLQMPFGVLVDLAFIHKAHTTDSTQKFPAPLFM